MPDTTVTDMAISIEGGKVVVRFANIDLSFDPDIALDFAQKLAMTAASAMSAKVARDALASAADRGTRS